jgi:hypothetical protein
VCAFARERKRASIKTKEKENLANPGKKDAKDNPFVFLLLNLYKNLVCIVLFFDE